MSRRSWPTTSATVVELEPSAGGVERPVFRFVGDSGATRTGVGMWSFPVMYVVGDVVEIRYDPGSDAILEPPVEERPGVARLMTPEGRRHLEAGMPIELAGLIQVAVSDHKRRGRVRPRGLSVSIVSPTLRLLVGVVLVVLASLLFLARMQLMGYVVLGYALWLFLRLRSSRSATSPAADTYLSPRTGPVGTDPPEGPAPSR